MTQADDDATEVERIPDISRGEILYRRAQALANASFVVAAVVLAGGIYISVQGLPWHSPLFPERNLDALRISAASVRGYVEFAFIIVGMAVLALTAARTAAADSRPSWAPLIDEKFARRADSLAMAAYAFVGAYFLVIAIYAIYSARLLVQTGTMGMSSRALLDRLLSDMLYPIWRIFVILLGALIVQSLVLVATRDNDTSAKAEETASDE